MLNVRSEGFWACCFCVKRIVCDRQNTAHCGIGSDGKYRFVTCVALCSLGGCGDVSFVWCWGYCATLSQHTVGSAQRVSRELWRVPFYAQLDFQT